MVREMAGPKFKFPYSQKKKVRHGCKHIYSPSTTWGADNPWGLLATSLAPDPVEIPSVLLWPLDVYMDIHSNT